MLEKLTILTYVFGQALSPCRFSTYAEQWYLFKRRENTIFKFREEEDMILEDKR